jgi:alpha-D-xyloside xylohydrolase
MRRFRFCDFTFNPDLFADPKASLTKIKKKFNVKICCWINAYIAQESPLFEEGMKNNYLIRRRNGDVWQWDYWQPGMGIVDFTNPAAREWYASYLHKLVDMGVDSFKTDFGEDVPYVDAQFHDGSDPLKMHNYFSLLYNGTVFDVLKSRFGENKACLFARASTAGGQRLPVHWAGDNESTEVAMAETLRGGLSIATSGFGFWSHDIGGFEGLPPANLYKRWVAFGLLSTHSRLHGSETYRVPWNYDDEACDVLGLFTKLKCRLMPYLYSQAVISVRTGIPFLRPVFFDFDDDPTVWYLDRQYLLGDYLLVAPVFEQSGDVEFYIPAGTWTRWFDSEDGGKAGETITGPKWMRERYSVLSIPLFVREGAILVLGKEQETQVEYDYLNDVEIRVYNGKAQAERLVVDKDGKEIGSIRVTGGGEQIEVEVPAAMQRWKAVAVNQGEKVIAQKS